MNKFFCSLLITSIYYSFLAAQPQITFEHFSQKDGLLFPMFKGIIQDREGFIWIGTLNGVHRYDGFNFKAYKFDPTSKATITKGFVNVVYEDKKGEIWIGTSSGLNNLNRTTGEFKQFVPDPKGPLFRNNMFSVYEDSKGILWVGAAMGLYTMNDSTGQLQLHAMGKNKEALSNLSYFSITEDKNGYLWLGTNIGLMKYDRTSNEFIPVWIDPNADKLTNKNWSTGDYSVQCIYTDESGILWVGAFGGKLIKLNPITGKMTHYDFKNHETSEIFPIQSITGDEDNKLWVGTFSGLLLFDKIPGKIIAHYTYDENDNGSLGDDRVTSVLKDKSGTLWIGTLSGGLNKLNRTKFSFNKIIRKSWATDKSYSQVPFIDFLVSRSGTLLIGTTNGIEELFPGQDRIVKHKPYEAINILTEDSRGNLWIGIKQYSGGGLYKKDSIGKLYPVVDSLGRMFTKEIQCLYESKKGRIYFGSEFYLFEINTENNSASLIFQTNRRLYSIGEDKFGNLWMGTLAGGAFAFDPAGKKVINHFTFEENNPSSISDNSITCFYTDKKGRLWLGTSSGLNKYDPTSESFKFYDERHGLTHNAVVIINEDESGNLWLGTGSGIAKFNPETEEFHNYDESYGLAADYHYAAGKASDGELFFKARKGITYFHPDSVKDNPFIPPVKITELKVFNNSFSFEKNVVLSHTENYLSFEFAALSFISPEKNQYAYKMEGVDKDWIFSGERRYAAYTDLPPGRYKFFVKASNNDGMWNNEGTFLSITILPPWWQTYWAYGLYFIALMLILYALRKYDLKRQNLKYQLQTEHEYAQKMQDISQMKSRFFTNISHEFRTPLTLIIGPADNIISGNGDDAVKEASMIKKNAIRLLRLINQLLDITRLDEGRLDLKVSSTDIAAFIRSIVMIFESLALSKGITLIINSSKDIINGFFDKEKLEKILINLISNSLKFTPGGGKVYVTLSELSGKLIIKIKDTGIGIPEKEISRLFDRFYQVDNSHTREYSGTGIGLSLTKELVELHKGTISVESKFGEWTEFTIELPIGRKAYDDNQIIEITDKETNYPDEKHLYIKEQIKADLAETLISSDVPDEPHSEVDSDDKMILLIVEDNADVREYIKQFLKDEFIIEEASNGEQGIEKAMTIVPDLIISDIMMPKMDGYEMTRILKADVKTNHIPIIHLTAKSDRVSKFEGLEIGADDYLIKPFDNTELLIRIRNLINIRRTLQEKFSGKNKTAIINEVKKLNPLDEKFMTEILDIISRHMAEEEFSVEEFGKEAGMSRVQLHRKLKAITGKSASRYIRSYRLSVAKEMIEQQKGNISEIAYSVGFSSPVYFSKCFKEEYGLSPSSLRPMPLAGDQGAVF
jgi:signal transduction histidine kinase/ligand-binding sensor domain-containing protein/DNA-binding response OmpR family regulator